MKKKMTENEKNDENQKKYQKNIEASGK